MGIVSGCVDWEQVRREKNTLTIRDQFAMAVATGIHASDNGDSSRWPYTMADPYEAIATAAYLHADAMMRAKER